jgi:excisionase family DNA binding protein
MTTRKNLSLLDMKSVAAMLKVNYATVQRLAATGKIASIRIGRAVRIRPEAVDQFLRSREVGGAAKEKQRWATKRRPKFPWFSNLSNFPSSYLQTMRSKTKTARKDWQETMTWQTSVKQASA